MIDCLFIPYSPDYSVKVIEPTPNYNMGIVKYENDDVFESLDNVNMSIFDLADFEDMGFNQIIDPLREYIQKKKPRLILGLDHGLSYPLISAVNADNVVHVDFHHDTYEAPPMEFLAHSNWAKKLLEAGYTSKWLWLHTSDYPNISDNPFHLLTYNQVIDFVKFYNDEYVNDAGNNVGNDDIPPTMVESALECLISGQNWLSDGDFYLSVCADGVCDFKDFSNDYKARLSDFSFENMKKLLMLGPEYVDLMEFGSAFLNPERTSCCLTYIQEIIDILNANPHTYKPLLKL